MSNVDWSCLGVQAALTIATFWIVNYFLLYKENTDGSVPTVKKEDIKLYLNVLLSLLVGYWATTYVKSDCRQESKP
jgi:hypothetical protein